MCRKLPIAAAMLLLPAAAPRPKCLRAWPRVAMPLLVLPASSLCTWVSAGDRMAAQHYPVLLLPAGAILRHVGRKYGLYGADLAEQAAVDEVIKERPKRKETVDEDNGVGWKAGMGQ